MVNFELYRIFVAVADEENITKASEKLNISQPAITKQIKNLENQLSIKLFERKSKGVALTNDGKKIYEKLKSPIEELTKIDAQIGKEKVINIGTHNHMGGLIFGKAINQYTLKYPNVNLNLVCEKMDELLRKLKNKEIDIVFAKKYDNDKVQKGLKFIKLGNMHETFIVNKQSGIAGQTLTFDNLKGKMIYIPREYEQTTKRIKELTQNSDIDLKLSNYRSIVRLVNDGMVIGVVTAEYLYDWEWNEFNLVEVENNIGLGECEFGIYLNANKFRELDLLINIIKKNFNQ